MLFLRRAHSPDRPPLDSDPLPMDYETRALTNAPPGTRVQEDKITMESVGMSDEEERNTISFGSIGDESI